MKLQWITMNRSKYGLAPQVPNYVFTLIAFSAKLRCHFHQLLSRTIVLINWTRAFKFLMQIWQNLLYNCAYFVNKFLDFPASGKFCRHWSRLAVNSKLCLCRCRIMLKLNVLCTKHLLFNTFTGATSCQVTVPNSCHSLHQKTILSITHF